MINRDLSIIKKTAILSAFVICFGLYGEMASAQNGGFAGAYNRMGFGARGMGMGNAMTALYQQGIYAHYNPALSALVEDTQIDVSVAMMQFDRSLNTASVAFRLPPSAGMNIGINHASVSGFDGRTTSGNPTREFSITEMNLFMAFGINVSPKLSLGISAKLFYADFFRDVDSQTAFGIDIGALYRYSENLSFGFAVTDLLTAYNWDTTNLYGTAGSSTRNKFPVMIKFGSAYRFDDVPLLISLEKNIQIQQSEIKTRELNTSFGGPAFITSTENVSTHTGMVRLGTAYEIHERITLRGGWQAGDTGNIGETWQFSTGFSVHLPFDRFAPSIDYAFIREPEGISSIHVFALRLRL